MIAAVEYIRSLRKDLEALREDRQDDGEMYPAIKELAGYRLTPSIVSTKDASCRTNDSLSDAYMTDSVRSKYKFSIDHARFSDLTGSITTPSMETKDVLDSLPTTYHLMDLRGGFGPISYTETPPRPHGLIPANHTKEMPEQIANSIPPLPVAAGTVPPPLPPSVEEAYRKKCIELKRRMTEVEESNDVFRVRKARLMRGIRKMRLERAYLLEILGKRMRKNGSSIDGFQQTFDEESDGSSEGPPTVRHPDLPLPVRIRGSY